MNNAVKQANRLNDICSGFGKDIELGFAGASDGFGSGDTFIIHLLRIDIL